jgi:hypothetical protein
MLTTDVCNELWRMVRQPFCSTAFNSVEDYASSHEAYCSYVILYNRSFSSGTALDVHTTAMGGRVDYAALASPKVKNDIFLLLRVNDYSQDITYFDKFDQVNFRIFAGMVDGKFYGLPDIKAAVNTWLISAHNQFSTGIGISPKSASYIPSVSDLPLLAISVCDCGGRKAGYSDQEKHGHAHWCSVNARRTK